MKSMFLFILVVLSMSAVAQVECEEPTASGVEKVLVAALNKSECPNGKDLPTLCLAIGGHTKDPSKKHDFYYQRIIFEAACIAPTDNEATQNRKIQEMWTQFREELTCNNTRFNVQNGNVLKYAVSAKLEFFLFEAAMIWKVDLNRVDPSDNKTVLDYVASEIERNKGNGVEKELRSYYDMLKSSGAKHKSEL